MWERREKMVSDILQILNANVLSFECKCVVEQCQETPKNETDFKGCMYLCHKHRQNLIQNMHNLYTAKNKLRGFCFFVVSCHSIHIMFFLHAFFFFEKKSLRFAK